MDLTTSAATSAACEESSPVRTRRPVTFDTDLQLGPMATKLHRRRMLRALRRRVPCRRHPEARTLASLDGTIQFVVWAGSHGLYVERTQRRSSDAHLTQFMLFGNAGAFLKWCEDDPTRFDYPLLHSELHRIGHD